MHLAFSLPVSCTLASLLQLGGRVIVRDILKAEGSLSYVYCARFQKNFRQKGLWRSDAVHDSYLRYL